MLITQNLTSSCCCLELSPQPEPETWCRGLSRSSLTPESLQSLHTANTWEAVSGETRCWTAWVRIPALPLITHGQVDQPCCASLFLPVKRVDVKMNYVNICKGLRDLDLSMLCKEVFAVTIIISDSAALLQALSENFDFTF